MKKTFIALSALAVLAAVSLTPEIANAYKGDPAVKGPNYTEERHEAMTKAFETNDYEAWKALMQGRGRVMQVVNKDNFAKFAQAHRLALQGKTDEANAIRQELGLGTGNGSGKMGGNCMR